MIWINKYKPKNFNEIIGLDESIVKLSLDSSKLPNFIFYGPAGTGKTTTSQMIINKRNSTYLQLNASDERGIDTIRERVKSFAMTKSHDNSKKIILLDEADQLTKEAFASLRGIMDKYSNNCSFILTCNWFNKIIDPLKSRCVCIEFKKPKKEDIIQLLKNICIKEEIKEYTDEGISNIIETTYPDIRRAIKELETIYNRDGKITDESTNTLKNSVDLILKNIIYGKVKEAINIYESEQIDEENLMVKLSDELYYGEYSIDVKKNVMKLIRIAYVEMSKVISKKLIIRPFFVQLKEVLK